VSYISGKEKKVPGTYSSNVILLKVAGLILAYYNTIMVDANKSSEKGKDHDASVICYGDHHHNDLEYLVEKKFMDI
jgi:hypothetical protein